jgi:tripartite-type tricarboxylate transporter receptor subunit TctC
MTAILKRLLLGCMALVASANVSAADPFPTRPIRVIIPFAPGGLLDVNMRWIAERMAANLGQPVIVENRAGGEGLIAIRSVKTAPADGYTLLATSSLFSQALALKQEPGYESKDFVAVGMTSEAPLLMVGPVTQPDTTLAQLLARAKANPEAVTYGSGGVGTAAWLAATMLAASAGVKMLHVPYKGIAATKTDLVAGRLNFIMDTPGSVAPFVKEGQLRVFGVTTLKRLSAYPDVPTLAEQGISNFSYAVYGGVLAPAGTPREVVTRLDEAMRAVVNTEAYRERCKIDGCEVTPLDSQQFAERVRQDTQKVAKLAADLGMPKQ